MYTRHLGQFGWAVASRLLIREQLVRASAGQPLVNGEITLLVVVLVVLAVLASLARLARGGGAGGGGGGLGDGGVGGDDGRGDGGVLGALVGQGVGAGAGDGGLGGVNVLVVLVDLGLVLGLVLGRRGNVAGVVVARQGRGVGLLDREAAAHLVGVDAADGANVTGRGCDFVCQSCTLL